MPFLAQAVESVLLQSDPVEDFLAVDDASTDGSLELLLSSRWSGRIRIVKHTNPTGFVDAWNRAVSLSAGEYVALLHQDDFLDASFVSWVRNTLSEHPGCRHVAAGCRYVDEFGAETGGTAHFSGGANLLLNGAEYGRRYLRGAVGNVHLHRCPGVVTERKLVVEGCPYRSSAGLRADDDFFVRVGKFTNVVVTDRRLAAFRHHQASVSAQVGSMPRELAFSYLFSSEDARANPGVLGCSEVEILDRQAALFLGRYILQGAGKGAGGWQSECSELARRLSALPGPGGLTAAPAWVRVLLACQAWKRGPLQRLVVGGARKAVELRQTALKLSRKPAWWKRRPQGGAR